MTISTLIAALSAIKDHHGDIEVEYATTTYQGLPAALKVEKVSCLHTPTPFVLLSDACALSSFHIDESPIPPEAAEVINENFWDLVLGESKPGDPAKP